ncbi:homeobox-like domain superfamily [Holotrichia oblita]|uniref:Homeobox-like domain superfamily n=1 Tax=Holotrichia oblita TaxID=644536 RepID=A0ACB9TAW8_HOLOL|nr:homeobox-like domain superfamily [Holotrichia oblita]
MADNPQRTSTRQTWNEGAMLNAIDAVKNGEMGWLKAAKPFNVPQATLRRRANDVNKKAIGCAKVLGRFSSTFNEAEEKELVGHILLLKYRLFGLTGLTGRWPQWLGG